MCGVAGCAPTDTTRLRSAPIWSLEFPSLFIWIATARRLNDTTHTTWHDWPKVVVALVVCCYCGIVAKQKLKLLYGQAKCMCTTCTLTHTRRHPRVCVCVWSWWSLCNLLPTFCIHDKRKKGRWFVTRLQSLAIAGAAVATATVAAVVVVAFTCCGHSLSPHTFYLLKLFALLIFGAWDTTPTKQKVKHQKRVRDRKRREKCERYANYRSKNYSIASIGQHNITVLPVSSEHTCKHNDIDNNRHSHQVLSDSFDFTIERNFEGRNCITLLTCALCSNSCTK